MRILGIKSVVIKKFKPYNPKKVTVINKPNLLQFSKNDIINKSVNSKLAL